MDLTGWISNFFSQIGDLISDGAEKVIDILPSSPFQYLTQTGKIGEILQNVNYFIPVNYFLSILQLWIVAVGGYYAWQVILRFFKAVE